MSARRLHACFSGMVQGIGFRVTAYRFAEGLPVKGFVRNLPDGRVELMAEGDEEDLEIFLKKIRSGFLSSFITGAEIRWLEPRGEFQEFTIG